MENTEKLVSANDIATEILSRLPIKSLVAFKCTSKRWYSFLSDPLFLRIHYQRSKQTTVLVMHNMLEISNNDTKCDSVDLVTPTKTGYELNYKSLDFLPEKVVVLSSSNGILCCRSWFKDHLRIEQKEIVTYVCNPITRQWVHFRSNIEDYTNCSLNIYVPGFAFYPTVCSSTSSSGSGASSMFKLVTMFFNHDSSSYMFDIYSSDTKMWKRSKAVYKTRTFRYDHWVGSHPPRVIFANGWLHWLITEYEIVAFHVENELCKLIKMPCVGPGCILGRYVSEYICWGESEGYFHYVYAHGPQLQVWVLKNYNDNDEEPAWELKYSLDMVCFANQHSSLCLSHEALNVLTFHEDVLYIKAWPRVYRSGNLVSCNFRRSGSMASYNFRTKTLIDHGECARQSEKDPDSTIVFPFEFGQLTPIIVPFSASLEPLQGVRLSQRNRKRTEARQMNRKRKLLKI